MNKLFLVSLMLLCSCGCFGGFKRNTVVKHPDTSVMIIKIYSPWFGEPQILIAGYDKAKNKMIEIGWVDLSKFEAWTLTKYDWKKKILERAQ